jgi:hypothetical protein
MTTLSQLESQLAELNRLIFETKCESVNQPVYTPVNLSLSTVTVTNNKHNETNLIIGELAHIAFLESGKSVTIIKPKRNKALSKRYFGL